MSTSWTPDYGTLDQPIPTWAPKKPIRIALLADFSAGAAHGRLETGAELARRKPLPVEFDTLEDALARMDVRLSLGFGDDRLAELSITELESFHPDELYRSLETCAQLASLRKQLNNPATFAKAAAQLQNWTATGTRKLSQQVRSQKARGRAPTVDARLSDFARLVGQDGTSSPDTPASDRTVDALVRRIVGPFVVPAANPQKDQLIASVDAALADAMRAVLHHPDFQTLESLWRGVDFLVRRLETGPNLQVHLIDISAEEFAADLARVDDLSESGLYKLLVDGPSQDKNGGYTLLCGLYRFEATPPHTELLGRMAQIAQHAGATFITEMGVDGLQDRKRPPHALVRQALAALQQLPTAAHLCLMGPRFLLRLPYGKRSDPISSFAFEEFSDTAGLSGMLWGHPALLAACALTGPGGTTIGDLPFHHYRDAQGDVLALPCTDRLVRLDAATTLHGLGINALMAHKGAPELRLAWLDAVNGQALTRTGVSTPRTRDGIATHINVGAPLGVSATIRRAANPAEAAEAPDADSADLDLSQDTDSLSGDASNDDLDALLASLGTDSESSDDTSSDSTSVLDDTMDPELAALLASLD